MDIFLLSDAEGRTSLFPACSLASLLLSLSSSGPDLPTRLERSSYITSSGVLSSRSFCCKYNDPGVQSDSSLLLSNYLSTSSSVSSELSLSSSRNCIREGIFKSSSVIAVGESKKDRLFWFLGPFIVIGLLSLSCP